MLQPSLSLSLSVSVCLARSGLQVNYICCIRATSVDCVGACTFCGPGWCCSCHSAALWHSIWMQPQCREREREGRESWAYTRPFILVFMHTHTHTHSLLQAATTMRFAFISQTMRYQNIYSYKWYAVASLSLCVWHILNASIAISILIMNISVVRQVQGEAGDAVVICIHLRCLAANEYVLVLAHGKCHEV